VAEFLQNLSAHLESIEIFWQQWKVFAKIIKCETLVTLCALAQSFSIFRTENGANCLIKNPTLLQCVKVLWLDCLLLISRILISILLPSKHFFAKPADSFDINLGNSVEFHKQVSRNLLYDLVKNMSACSAAGSKFQNTYATQPFTPTYLCSRHITKITT
jgi:hypothetical protein